MCTVDVLFSRAHSSACWKYKQAWRWWSISFHSADDFWQNECDVSDLVAWSRVSQTLCDIRMTFYSNCVKMEAGLEKWTEWNMLDVFTSCCGVCCWQEDVNLSFDVLLRSTMWRQPMVCCTLPWGELLRATDPQSSPTMTSDSIVSKQTWCTHSQLPYSTRTDKIDIRNKDLKHHFVCVCVCVAGVKSLNV